MSDIMPFYIYWFVGLLEVITQLFLWNLIVGIV